LLLTGCVPPAGDPTPTPAASSTPVFASEEEALAAAEEAYAAYLAVSDAITADGGANPERIEPFVSAAQYEAELEGFRLYGERGWHTAGASRFEKPELQVFADYGDGSADVSMYVCSDLSALRILDETGVDVTPPDVVDRQLVEVVFSAVADRAPLLRLESTELWNSGSGC
jgi:hypothetical protein